jgi:hypothetical protein
MNIQNWFMGVVEDVSDPLEMGRIRVRCFGYHNPDRQFLPTKDLPWMQTIFPVTAGPASGEIGSSPTLELNSIVFGAFYDGSELQDAIILGTVPGGVLTEANYNPETNIGFGSAFGPFGRGIPNGLFPGDNFITSASVGLPAPISSAFPDGVYPTPTQVLGGAGDKIASIAEREAGKGIIENAGQNQDTGGQIAKYWTATTYPGGYAAREPWCAAFCCWCVREANVLPENVRPKSAGSKYWITWGEKHSDIAQVFHRGIGSGGLVRGDFLVKKKVRDDKHGHISIVTKPSDSSGNFETIDGNGGPSTNRVLRVTGPSRNLNNLHDRMYIVRIKETGIAPNQGFPVQQSEGGSSDLQPIKFKNRIA